MPFNASLLLFHPVQGLDRQVTLAINGTHTATLDALMVFASDRNVWFPFYALLIAFLGYVYRRRALLLVPLLLATVSLADIITSRLFKPYFGRLRPCHEPDLAPLLHLPAGCGGQFGFLSSHASNSMALAVFLLLALPPGRFRWVQALVMGWAMLLCYSRLYLGAHYLTDVLGGALVGALLAALGTKVFQHLSPDDSPAQ